MATGNPAVPVTRDSLTALVAGGKSPLGAFRTAPGAGVKLIGESPFRGVLELTPDKPARMKVTVFKGLPGTEVVETGVFDISIWTRPRLLRCSPRHDLRRRPLRACPCNKVIKDAGVNRVCDDQRSCCMEPKACDRFAQLHSQRGEQAAAAGASSSRDTIRRSAAAGRQRRLEGHRRVPNRMPASAGARKRGNTMDLNFGWNFARHRDARE